MKSKDLIESLNTPTTSSKSGSYWCSGSVSHPFLSPKIDVIHEIWPSGVTWTHSETERQLPFVSCTQSQSRKIYHRILSSSHTVLAICYLITIFTLCFVPGTVGIDCFKCVSLNGNNPSCEDPFHNNYSVSILESPCMGGRKGRNGLFPATACIKLAGRYYDTGTSVTIRGCAVDSGTLNVDTEIIRMSHCGHFWFDDRYVKGCLQSCDDADGCNGSTRTTHFSFCATTLLLIIGSIGFPTYLFRNLLATHFHCKTRVL